MIATNQSAQPQSRRSSVFALTTHRLVIAVAFVLIFAIAVRIPVDSDTWWHLRSGEWMVENRTILMSDPFSVTRLGQTWVNHSWGAQLLMTGFYHLFGGTGNGTENATGGGGAVGLALYTAIMATAGMGFVYAMCEGNPFVRSFVLVLGATTAAVFWSARPQMTSFLLSAITLYVLYLYKWRKRDHLWILPLLMILWVNLHGGFAIGFILLFGSIGGEIAGRIFDGGNPAVSTWPGIGKLILITILCAAALVINPNTVQMWGYPFRTFGIGALQDFIQEWNSPNFHGRETWPFIGLIFGILAAVGLGSRKIDWADLLLVSGTAFMGLYAGRNIATFALVATPVLARHLASLLEERGLYLPRPRPPKGAILVLNYALLGLVLLGAGLYIVSTLAPRSVTKAQAEYMPVAAAAYLNANVDPQTGAMFNSYNWGGYLMFAAPRFPVFVDGRTDLYDDQLLREWLSTTAGKNWEQTFAQWKISIAVIERESALAGALRTQAGWREAWSDAQAAIFIKVNAP